MEIAEIVYIVASAVAIIGSYIAGKAKSKIVKPVLREQEFLALYGLLAIAEKQLDKEYVELIKKIIAEVERPQHDDCPGFPERKGC